MAASRFVLTMPHAKFADICNRIISVQSEAILIFIQNQQLRPTRTYEHENTKIFQPFYFGFHDSSTPAFWTRRLRPGVLDPRLLRPRRIGPRLFRPHLLFLFDMFKCMRCASCEHDWLFSFSTDNSWPPTENR